MKKSNGNPTDVVKTNSNQLYDNSCLIPRPFLAAMEKLAAVKKICLGSLDTRLSVQSIAACIDLCYSERNLPPFLVTGCGNL